MPAGRKPSGRLEPKRVGTEQRKPVQNAENWSESFCFVIPLRSFPCQFVSGRQVRPTYFRELLGLEGALTLKVLRLNLIHCVIIPHFTQDSFSSILLHSIGVYEDKGAVLKGLRDSSAHRAHMRTPVKIPATCCFPNTTECDPRGYLALCRIIINSTSSDPSTKPPD